MARVSKKRIFLTATLCVALFLSRQCCGQTPSAPVSGSNSADSAPASALPTVIVLEGGVMALPPLRPKESGVAATELTKWLRDSERRLNSNPKVKPQMAKLPRVTFEFLEPDRVNADPPRGAISIEAAFFPEIIYPPKGLTSEESRVAVEKQKARRQVIWHWDVPAALRRGFMRTQPMSGASISFGGERFFPVTIHLEASALYHAVYNLYFFDATKGLLWHKDLVPLLQGHPAPLQLASFATLPDSRRTIVVATAYERTPDSGSRVIALDSKGNVLSITDIPGTYIQALARSASGNSLLLDCAVQFVGGKPFTGVPFSVSILVNGDSALVGRFTNSKGNFVMERVDVLASDRQAVAIEAGLWFEWP